MNFHKTIIVTVIFLRHSLAGAQVITGIVCDQDTKLPISDVHVYLDGTSINTITNNSGEFELNTKSTLNTRLVLHHLSYEAALIERPFEGLPDTLFLKGQMNTISEVTILADRFTREQKMKAFREQFLGASRAGRSCTIVNEGDIQLSVNMQTRRLLASSDKPIVVINDYLGYRISFILIDYWVEYGSFQSGLDNEFVRGSFFAVTSSFVDLAPDNRRIKRRRDNVFDGSSNHFFKSLANDDLKENNFMVFNKSFPVDYRNYFAMKDTLTLKMVSIIPDTDINRILTSTTNNITFADYSVPKLSGIISVLYRRRTQSDIYFSTDFFFVDSFGNIDQIDKISFGGQMGKNRAGDMLPIDYEQSNR